MADVPRGPGSTDRGGAPMGRRLPARVVVERAARESAADAAVPTGGPERPAGDGARSLTWWATLVTRGEVTARVRVRRAVVAAASSMVALLAIALTVLLWLAPAPVAVADDAPSLAVADEVPEVLLSRPIRVRVERRAVAARAQPADAVIEIPPDRAMQLGFWSLHCPDSATPPPVVSGRVPAGSTQIRIPKVPPVRCDVTFVGGAVQVSVTAGSVRRCTWSGQLVCR